VLLGRNGIIGGHIYEMTGWTIMFSWQAAVLASFIVSLPLMFKISKAAIASVDKEMVDSAYMLGYSELEAGVKIVLPLAKKGIFAGVILSFARAIGEFGATLMIAGNITDRTNTMPLAIYGYVSGGEWGKANTLVFILTLISGLFLYLANRFSREVY
jgi:molybdate transport system permease protein